MFHIRWSFDWYWMYEMYLRECECGSTIQVSMWGSHVVMKIIVFGSQPCSLVSIYYCFEETSSPHLQGETLNMEVAASFERFKTSYHVTRRHIPAEH
jgi:hypothetical protein